MRRMSAKTNELLTAMEIRPYSQLEAAPTTPNCDCDSRRLASTSEVDIRAKTVCSCITNMHVALWHCATAVAMVTRSNPLVSEDTEQVSHHIELMSHVACTELMIVLKRNVPSICSCHIKYTAWQPLLCTTKGLVY